VADPIRVQILDALTTTLGTITTLNGYRMSLTTVEILSKDWNNPDMYKDLLPWCGVIPEDETVKYQPFAHQVVDWPILIVVHFELQTRTAAGLLAETEAIRTDVRKAVHSDFTLGVEGVHFISLAGFQTSVASAAAIQKGHCGVATRATVRFTESNSAS